MYKSCLKRCLDIVLSLCGIIVLSPILLIVAIITKLDTPGPILFKQKRVGIHKTYFNIYKFRSMKIDAPHDIPTHELKDPSVLMSKWGAFMRKSSLDELHQLFNILMGHMAIVGPRPALWNQYDLIKERDKYHANDVRPGLTGLAQTSGRNAITWEEKFEKDIEYVHNISFIGDVKIIIKTAIKVFKREGISGTNSDTMQKFEGNKEKINV